MCVKTPNIISHDFGDICKILDIKREKPLLFKLDKIYFFNLLDIFYDLSYHKQALNIAG